MSLLADYDLLNETIFKPTNRISMVPYDNNYADIWKNLEIQKSSFWTSKKIDFTKDKDVFPKLPEEIQTCTKKILGYFARSDEIIEEIIAKSCLSKIQIPEIVATYKYESMMEKIHSEVYNLNIQAVIPNLEERDKIFHAVDNMPFVKLKADNAIKFISDKRHPGYTIVGKAGSEGINFSASFAWIDWLKTQKYDLEGTLLANTEISRDEARHVDTSFLVYKVLDYKQTPDNVAEVLDECERIERLFIEDALPKIHLDGMCLADMYSHIKHTKSFVANGLGFTKLYGKTTTPFKFMLPRSLNSKANFFEKDSANYTRLKSDESVDNAFTDDARF